MDFQYISNLENTLRNLGIVVPLTFNDVSIHLVGLPGKRALTKPTDLEGSASGHGTGLGEPL